MKNQFKVQFVDPVEKLKKKSESVISVFTKTVDELVQVDHEIDKQIEERKTEIADLQLELDALNETRTRNESVIGKIKAFFGE